ncbi:MAG: hypothetical protein R3263_07665 [Myxococcota bacterium]|nr:hypothetical protein [Myxococcota bacterium]
MVHESMRNLRLDKRLLRRRGWIAPEELEKELEALPDAEPKAERVPVLETEESREGAGS